MDDPVLADGLLIFGFLAIVLAPMALALAYTRPGGAGWKLLTFLCCALAAWSLCFTSSLLIGDCGVGPSVGERDDGHPSAFFQSTPCMIRNGRQAGKLLRKDDTRSIAEKIARLPELCARAERDARGSSNASMR